MKHVISVVLCLSVIVFGGIYVFFIGAPHENPAVVQGGILRLWHIDSFEGGKGSRAAFLNRAAMQFEKKNEGVYIMVNTYTAEGASKAVAAGERPDLLSFSCGIDGAAELCRSLSPRFSGGEIGEKCYAYPWCGGEYFIFCLENDFSSLSADTLLLSDGGENLPWVAAALCGVTGNAPSEDSTSAYVHFLNGKYRYMLGTQRDACRFQTRGVIVYSRPLTEYNDLFQYIAVTTPDEDALAACEGFVSSLLSAETQQKLSDIGMKSAKDLTARYTLSAFADKNAVRELREKGKNALVSGDIKILKTYLKALN